MAGPGFELGTVRSVISAVIVLFRPVCPNRAFLGRDGMGRKLVKCDLEAAIGACEVPEHAACEVPLHAVELFDLASNTFPYIARGVDGLRKPP